MGPPYPYILNPELTPSQRELMLAMLAKNAASFATPLHPPRAAHGVEHTIHLSDPHPVKQAPYKQSPAKSAEITRQLAEFIKDGRLVPSNSPWASPVSLVRKPGENNWRLVIDYRRVNAQTIKDAYPMPHIETLLYQCRTADWLTLLDIKDAYHHIEMALASRGITAIVTPDGLFEWTRMPFGLTNAPATFQRYVDSCLRDFIGRFVIAFFDDCLVYTTGSFEQHILDVEKALVRLNESALECSAKKCKFGFKELLFVGHYIGRGRIRMDPEKISAVTEHPTPTNVSQLRAFLGLANYYRRFIQGFALIAAPLYTLLRKGVVWEWSQAAIASFENLKTALTTAPCLFAPNFGQPFHLQTDACGIGIAAVLSQRHPPKTEEEEHPVAYVSRQLNIHEQNYSPVEWECLAVVWALSQFEPYLIDAPFTIWTDASALQWLATKRLENKRLTRWALTLQEFNYTIKHRPGKANANADALSRNPRHDSAPPLATQHDERSAAVHGARDPHFIRRAVAALSSPSPLPCIACLRRARTPRASADGDDPMEDIEEEAIDEDGIVAADTDRLNSFITAQRNDPELHTLIAYLERREIPAGRPAWELDRLRRDARRFALEDVGLKTTALVYAPTAGKPEEDQARITLNRRLVVPAAERAALLQLFHDSPFSGHGGVKRTFARLSTKFYWPSMHRDVTHYVSQCTTCQRLKAERRAKPQPRGRMPDPLYPFELVSLDFAGPFKKCEDFEYALIIVDHFTGYCITVPTQLQQAATVARAFVDEVVCKHGLPTRIYTDRASNFRNELMADLTRLLGIKSIFSSAHHPQAHGKVERLVGSVKNIMTTILTNYDGHWVNALQPATFAYNTGKSQATGFTPFFLVHGREAIQPGDLLSPVVADEGETPQAYALDLQTRLKDTRNLVAAIIQSKAEQVIAANQQLQNIPTFEVGSLVWLRDPTMDSRTGGRTRTFAAYFLGPYRVEKRIGDLVYEIRAYKNDKPVGPTFTVHAERLRFHAPSSHLGLYRDPAGKILKSPRKVSFDLSDHSPAQAAKERHQADDPVYYGEGNFLPAEPVPQQRYSLPPRT